VSDQGDGLDGQYPGPGYKPGARPFGKPWPPLADEVSSWATTRVAAAVPPPGVGGVGNYVILPGDRLQELTRASSPMPILWQVDLRVRPFPPLLTGTPMVFSVAIGMGRVTWPENDQFMGASPFSDALSFQFVASLITVSVRFAVAPGLQDGFQVHARTAPVAKGW